MYKFIEPEAEDKGPSGGLHQVLCVYVASSLVLVIFWEGGTWDRVSLCSLRLSWNSHGGPGWPRTQRPAYFCLASAWIKGICHLTCVKDLLLLLLKLIYLSVLKFSLCYKVGHSSKPDLKEHVPNSPGHSMTRLMLTGRIALLPSGGLNPRATLTSGIDCQQKPGHSKAVAIVTVPRSPCPQNHQP